MSMCVCVPLSWAAEKLRYEQKLEKDVAEKISDAKVHRGERERDGGERECETMLA